METEECACCVSQFTTRRFAVKCPKCSFQICSPCFERYTLDNLAIDYIGTVCMSCKEPLSFDFIVSNTSKTFVSKKWRDKRKEILIGIEKAKLADTQNTAAKYREFNTIMNNLRELIQTDTTRLLEMFKITSTESLLSPRNRLRLEIGFKIKELEDEYNLYKSRMTNKNYSPELRQEYNEMYTTARTKCKKARKLYKNLKSLVREYTDTSYRFKYFMSGLNTTEDDIVDDGDTDISVRERRQFIMPCPLGDCKGFMSSAYKCGLCKEKICPKCHIQLNGKDEQHICDKNLVESVKAINEETKPCPKCGARISKINGCDQMWCLHCKTAFSWNTGKIVQGERIHNPEYFRWMREHNQNIPRVEDQINCDELPDMYELDRLQKRGICTHEHVSILIHLLRIVYHLREVEMPALDTSINKDLRVKYLCDELDEQKMTTILLKRERKSMKNSFLAGMYRLIIDVISDKLKMCAKLGGDLRDIPVDEFIKEIDIYDSPGEKIMVMKSSREIVIDSIREVIQLCRYVNSQMENFEKLHGLKTPRFREDKNGLFEDIKKGLPPNPLLQIAIDRTWMLGGLDEEEDYLEYDRI